MALKAVVLFGWRGVCTKVLLFYLSQDKGFRHWSQRRLRSDIKYHGRHGRNQEDLVGRNQEAVSWSSRPGGVMEAVILVRKRNTSDCAWQELEQG